MLLESCGPPLREDDIAKFEERLGYKLPQDYREFLLKYNGGSPVVGDVVGWDDNPDIPYEHGDAINNFLKLPGADSSVEDYDALRTPVELGWDVPGYILPIACDAGGNCFVLELGEGEGVVRFLDHETLDEGPITQQRVIANDFLDLLLRVVSVEEKAAIRRLEAEAERKALAGGDFPRKLESQFQAVEDRCPEIRKWVRLLSLKLFDQKGHFSVHDDDLSRTVLDLAFCLYQNGKEKGVWIKRMELETMILCWWKEADNGFGLSGHASDYLKEWWRDRLATGSLQGTPESARFSREAEERLIHYLTGIDSEV